MTSRKTPLWQSIAAALTADISSGRYSPGDRLPTESELSARFGVNRHTVRRGLASLAEAGLTHARRGAGVFVAQRPTEYPIGRRVRFHQNIRAAGRLPSRKIHLNETRGADADEAAMLRLPAGSKVISTEGISLADGQPIALFRSVFPADRFPGLIDALGRLPSITAALAENGVSDYTRAFTRVNAKTASATQAVQLHLREGDPILRTISLSVDPQGTPVEYGRTWFSGDRVTLTLNEE
ncbi:phosphonate metabolism transcriptional regulator PhnF [Pseudooceanicola sediminis]|uniref:Phosphonate metabolism transcriptional regulator PhnF n=1 Tax=Pseudooceanicola sediminis TaxID=2211117 RepID=A0A399IYI4_9RHOB|nr:phosphonate metabolism transcriptional regulator PhnF [Pseudooceanicola sediminis]KAA2312041.1 phosphonate metabolism transcriptional regulator PhnF [Puniceibacterium sp. HSS470]RII38050.1 phosphonate metabolism transcriptional regulator PhnF [Pseudooceanicola sediminis]|tara:strand:- start:42037 stop:42753 length:717 start_codon:yes stop_codon:yes gene_type:complete